jgi:hypothetical protein
MKLIDPEKLKAKAIEVITKNKLIFIEDVCAMLGISKPTFYDKFKVESYEYYELRDLLEENKIALKVSMRKKWFDSDNATLQMGLYKLCSNSEEHKLLQQNYTEITGKDGKDLQPPQIVVSNEIQHKIIDDLFGKE